MNHLSTETYANIFASARTRIGEELETIRDIFIAETVLSIVADEIASELAVSDPLFGFDCFISKLGVDDVHREYNYTSVDTSSVVPIRNDPMPEEPEPEIINLMDAHLSDVRDLLSRSGMHVTNDYNRFEASVCLKISEHGDVIITETKTAKYYNAAPNYRPMGKSTYKADITIWAGSDKPAVGHIYGDNHKTLAACVKTAIYDYANYVTDHGIADAASFMSDTPDKMVVRDVRVKEIIDYKGETYNRVTLNGRLAGWQLVHDYVATTIEKDSEIKVLEAAYANRND